jgi:methyltransferase
VAVSVQLYLGFLALLYGERLLELFVSRRNTRRMLAAGASEVGQRHFRIMAIFHTLFPATAGCEVLLLDRAFPGAVGIIALALALLAQGLRWWSVVVLGPAWTVRVVVPKSSEPVTGGPYRWLRHPNYLAVVLEMAAVPLIHGAWLTAGVATLGNALLLRVRIPAEERALGQRYAATFANRSRLLPGVRRGRS